jgi:hypothetical protein
MPVIGATRPTVSFQSHPQVSRTVLRGTKKRGWRLEPRDAVEAGADAALVFGINSKTIVQLVCEQRKFDMRRLISDWHEMIVRLIMRARNAPQPSIQPLTIAIQ